MKLLPRILAGLFALLAVALVLAFLFRAPIAGAAIRSAMAGAGLEDPGLRVKKLSTSRIELADISLGPDAAKSDIEQAAVEYDLRRLWRERRVGQVTLGPGTLAIEINEDQTVSIAGRPLGGAKADGGLPFDGLVVDDLTILAETPKGNAQTKINGAFDADAGGSFEAQLQADAAGFENLRVENSTGEMRVALSENGDASFDGDFTGDLFLPAGAVRGASVEVDGKVSSWKQALAGGDAPLHGSIDLNLQSAELPAAESAALTSMASAEESIAPGEPIKSFSISGAVRAEFSDDRLTISGVENSSVKVETDRNDRIFLTGVSGEPLYERRGEQTQAGFALSLDSPVAAGSLKVLLHSIDGEAWEHRITAYLAEQAFSDVSLGATALESKGVHKGSVFEADLKIASLLENAKIGRLRIIDAPFAAMVSLTGDLSHKNLTVKSGDENCVRFARGRFELPQSNMKVRLSDANFCGSEAPLAIVNWGETPGANVAGVLTAPQGRYEIGRTVMQGAPPRIAFSADYNPATHLTNVSGALSGGNVILNDILRGRNAKGKFTAELTASEMSAKAMLSSMIVSQTRETPVIAPVSVSGDATLANREIAFDFAVETPDGLPIGDGDGTHYVETNTGKAVFKSGRLTLNPDGLRPDRLMPGFLGIVGDATGAVSADVNMTWRSDGNGIESQAALEFYDIAFIGPGRAVSKTEGLSGSLNLADLTPLQTAGEQFLTVKRIDLDALILEDGEISFALPGDNSLRVVKAEFPWFGGTIGAYETTASIAGDQAITELRADNVDLTQLLEYLDMDGLSGEGIVAGVLPLVVENGKAKIVDGEMSAIGPGVIRYEGKATNAAGATNQQVEMAFSILRNLKFEKLTAKINGPLDGTLTFALLFEGTNQLSLSGRGLSEPVTAPIIYRINIDAPLLALIDQARVSSDVNLQVKRAQGESDEEDAGETVD